jgi:hypothetical protein
MKHYIAAAALASSLGAQASDTYQPEKKDRNDPRIVAICTKFENKTGILLNGENECEISPDNGRTWKQYIPNVTSGIAGGGLAWLLALLAAGAVIMRYRRKDEYAIAPGVGKKYVPTPKTDIAVSQKNKWEPVAKDDTVWTTENLLSQTTEIWDWNVVVQGVEQLWDWDMVERVLAEEKARENKWTIHNSNPIKSWEDVVSQVAIPTDSNENDGIITSIDPNDIDTVISPKEDINKSLDSIAPADKNENEVDQENWIEDPMEVIKNRLQSNDLTNEEKKDISNIVGPISINELLKKNIKKGYWFILSNANDSITFSAEFDWGKLYYLDNDWSIQDSNSITMEWVARIKVLGKWYYQIVYKDLSIRTILLVAAL